MSTAAERATQLDLVARLKSAYPELPDAPTPDLIDDARFRAYMKTSHDVGGEPDRPIKYENKQYEKWEELTYILCEVLGARGIWLSEERRRMGNVDVGRAIYLGLPYYVRWLWAVARVLVEKHHIRLAELNERMVEVKARYEGGLAGRTPEAQPKCEGDGSQVKRNAHHIEARGKGDPGVYAGKADPAKFKVGDPVVVVEELALFYTRVPEYVRGAKGHIAALAYESPAAEDETWTTPRPSRSGCTSFSSTRRSCGTATPGPRRTPCGPNSPSAPSYRSPKPAPRPTPCREVLP